MLCWHYYVCCYRDDIESLCTPNNEYSRETGDHAGQCHASTAPSTDVPGNGVSIISFITLLYCIPTYRHLMCCLKLGLTCGIKKLEIIFSCTLICRHR